MCPGSSAQIAKLLDTWQQGDQEARDKLIPLVYGELRRLMPRRLCHERSDHPLPSALLANEAYLRLAKRTPPRWQNRVHSFGVVARITRRILANYARNRLSAKRGGAPQRLTLEAQLAAARRQEIDLVPLDDGLNKLAPLDAQQSRLAELRFFGRLSIDETASVMGVSSPATTKRESAEACAWL